MGCMWKGLGVGGLGLVGFCGLYVERTGGWGAGIGRVLWAVCVEDWVWGGWGW